MEGSRKAKIQGGNLNIRIFLRLFYFMLLVDINRGQKVYEDKYCLSQEWVFIFFPKKKLRSVYMIDTNLQCARHT